MAYAPVNGLQVYYDTWGTGRPLVLLHGGLMTIDLNWGPLPRALAASRQVIAVELQGHGHTAATDRAMTVKALASDVVGLLDHRDFSPLPDVLELVELLPNAQLAVLPGTTHVGVTQKPNEGSR